MLLSVYDGWLAGFPSNIFIERFFAGFEGAQDVSFDGFLRNPKMGGDSFLAHAIQAIEQKGMPAWCGQLVQGEPDAQQLLAGLDTLGRVGAGVGERVDVGAIDMDFLAHTAVVVAVRGEVGAGPVQPGCGVVRHGCGTVLQQAGEAFLDDVFCIVGTAPVAQKTLQLAGMALKQAAEAGLFFCAVGQASVALQA